MTVYAMITEYDMSQYVKVIRNIAGDNMKDKIIKDSYGFTLIEMIVVMIIIGILAAIMVPSLLHYIDRSKADECEVNRKALVLQLEGARAQDPGKTMYDIVNENEASGEVTCPSGGKYEAVDNNTVRCTIPKHGENGVLTDESEHAMGDVEVIVPEIPSTGPLEETDDDVEEDETKETNVDGEMCFKVDDIWFSSISADYFAEKYKDTKKYYFPENTVIAVAGKGFYLQYKSGGKINFNKNGYNVSTGDMIRINCDNVATVDDFFNMGNGDKLNGNILKGQIIKSSSGQYFVAVHNINNINDAMDQSNEDYWRPISLCSE